MQPDMDNIKQVAVFGARVAEILGDKAMFFGVRPKEYNKHLAKAGRHKFFYSLGYGLAHAWSELRGCSAIRLVNVVEAGSIKEALEAEGKIVEIVEEPAGDPQAVPTVALAIAAYIDGLNQLMKDEKIPQLPLVPTAEAGGIADDLRKAFGIRKMRRIAKLVEA